MEEDSFDTERFIVRVHKRPILWDTSLEEYHDKIQKQNAWTELTKIMYPAVTERDLTKRVSLLMKKWKNLKDNYMRYARQLKTGTVAKKKKYCYAKELSFLNCILGDTVPEGLIVVAGHSSEEKEEFDDSIPENAFASAVEAEVCISALAASASATSGNPQFATLDNPSARKRALEESMIAYLRTQASSYRPDEDQSFFDSLLPMVRQFDVDQKVEFRIQVMSLIQNIRRQNNAIHFETHSTTENKDFLFQHT